MYSLEKLKKLAVNQMRAATDLYETCETIEKILTKDNGSYNKLLIESQRRYRCSKLEFRLGLKPMTEEKDLWDEVMEELD